jgi:8-oxo-dGTP pyrophosphatase MutT (NUDIX family)
LSPDRERLATLRARLAARAQQPPPDDWLPVVIAGSEVGVAHPDVAGFLATNMPRFALIDYRLVLDDESLDVAARSALLFDAACRLRGAGLIWGWRDEQLDVRVAPEATPLATIERSACRALGITTLAVHLNALTPEGDLVVARRAPHKQIDPNFWDNLVGGMVPAGESALEALRREAVEEAGIDIAPLTLERGGVVRLSRRVREGYQSEDILIFNTLLPAGVTPVNQDGEVAAFATRTVEEVLAAIERDEFTLESALVTLDVLEGRLRGSQETKPLSGCFVMTWQQRG